MEGKGQEREEYKDTQKAASKRSGQTRKAGAPKERFAPVLKIVSGSEGFPTLQEMISEAGAST